MAEKLSNSARSWLYTKLSAAVEREKKLARKERTAVTRKEFGRAHDVIADAHEMAVVLYERAIEFHCLDERRAALFRKLQKL